MADVKETGRERKKLLLLQCKYLSRIGNFFSICNKLDRRLSHPQFETDIKIDQDGNKAYFDEETGNGTILT